MAIFLLLICKKLDINQKELYTRTDEILHYIWDPLGVSDEPYARDEYHSYLPNIFSLLLKTNDGSEIKDKLIDIERDSMGLVPNENKIIEVVEILISYKEIIFEDNN